MQWGQADHFPKPQHYASRVCVHKHGWFLAVLFLVSFAVIVLAVYQGAVAEFSVSGPRWFALALACMLLSMPLHEVLHLVAHPRCGANHESVMGWLRRFSVPVALWVGYAGWVSRKRTIYILLLPFCVLGVAVPIAGYMIGGEIGSLLVAIGAANIIGSRYDLEASASLLCSDARVVHDSRDGYYVPHAEGSARNDSIQRARCARR